jgi:putative transposase
MRKRHPEATVDFLCSIWGYSRVHFYQSLKKAKSKQLDRERIVAFVILKRDTKYSTKLGTEKIHYMMCHDKTMSDIKVGRDQLYHIMDEEGLTLRRKRRYSHQKTNGNGESIFDDYRKILLVDSINQLWCSDITYLYIGSGRKHAYLTLIEDEKSHKIVGYCLSWNQDAESVLEALKMAVQAEFPNGRTALELFLAFHTDRGGVFKSDLFKLFLEANHIVPSMCAAGKSHENPVAERINGILKNEILLTDSFASWEVAATEIERAIEYYNHTRPHRSNEMLTPIQAHKYGIGPLKKLWRQRKKNDQKQSPNN